MPPLCRQGFSRQFLEKLSDKSLEGSRASVLAALKAAKWRFWVRFDHSWESSVGLFRNYQTVSRMGIVGSSASRKRAEASKPRPSCAVSPGRKVNEA
jgi:hypothetical protein